MPYSLNKPTGATGPAISVPDNAIDFDFYDTGNNIGVQLIGQGAFSYGTAAAQNVIQMISNFAGTVVPNDTISLQGQLWFDNNSGNMYVRTGATGNPGGIANWTPLAIASGSTVTSFNTRTGAITLNSTDVSSALGYTPVSSVNAAGGTTGMTFTGGPITSTGTLTLGGVLEVANGGTGVTSMSSLTSAVLPSQAGNGGKFLTTNGSTPSWGVVPSSGGTVTSVSVSLADGITGSVANATSTPVISLGLGNITPTEVVVGTLPTTGTIGIHNGGAGLSGYISFVGSGSTRQGYIGTSNTNATVDAGRIPYVAGTHAFSGVVEVPTPTIPASAVNLSYLNTAIAPVTGAFTPVLLFGGSNTGMTLTTDAKYWVLPGNLVIAMIYITMTNKGSSTGTATITGIPFDPIGVWPGSTSMNNMTGLPAPASFILQDDGIITLRLWTSVGDATLLDDSYFTNTSIVQLVVSYHANI